MSLTRNRPDFLEGIWPVSLFWYNVFMSYDFSTTKTRFTEISGWLIKELSTIQTGRATPALLDGVLVDAYGSKTPLSQSASITSEDPRTLRVVPYDSSQIKSIEKGIVDKNVGVSVSVDDKGVRVIVSELTTETRDKYAKIVRAKLEEARVSVRKERDSTINNIRSKDMDLSEDYKKKSKEELEKLVKEGNEYLSEISEKKEKELYE